MKFREIRNEREFYEAIRDYSNKAWQWGAWTEDGYDDEPMPDELLAILEERIRWVKAHKKAVERYLDKQGGLRWLRVIEGSQSESKDQAHE